MKTKKPIGALHYYRSLVLAGILFFACGGAWVSGQVVCETLKSFGVPVQIGCNPRGALIEDGVCRLYGTTYAGGESNAGTIFRINPDGSGYLVLKQFASMTNDGAHPAAGLLMVNGVLYGTTRDGGSNYLGTLFKLNADGGGYQTLRSFTGADGANPLAALIRGSDGLLYGTTQKGGETNCGTVFRLNTNGGGFELLRSFAGPSGDGAYPRAALLQAADGYLYGTTQAGGSIGNGTVFRLGTNASDYLVLKSFGAATGEGAEPYAPLVMGTNGALYGTTLHGGVLSQGTLFRINPDGSGYAVIRSFNGTDGANPYAGLTRATNGMLYGLAYNGGLYSQGLLFGISHSGDSFAILQQFQSTNGAFPISGLMQAGNGFLYGATEKGGTDFSGTLFALDLVKLYREGVGYALLKNFSGAGNEGQAPEAGLIQGSDGRLYGMTPAGGSGGRGTVFRANPDGGDFQVIRNFSMRSTDSQSPAGALMFGTNGVLYGTTTSGGANSCGTIFRMNPDGSGSELLRSFSYSTEDGYRPGAALIQGKDGWLYGTTVYGGSAYSGTAFKLTSAGGSFQLLKSFGSFSVDGRYPSAPLFQSADGVLYGTTPSGGSNGYGTVFRLSTTGSGYGGYRVLVNFTANNGDGASPYSSLIQATNGALYGTTSAGGSNHCGTVFKLNTNNTGYAVLKSFTGSYGDGAFPYAALARGSNGVLYGTTSAGGVYGKGVVFSLNADGSCYAVLKSFTGLEGDGASPRSPLLAGRDGVFYGTTQAGGTLGVGVIYDLIPPTGRLSPVPMADGLRLRMSGLPGYPYRLERAATVSGPWFDLDMITADLTGLAQFEDHNPPANQAFYRTVIER